MLLPLFCGPQGLLRKRCISWDFLAGIPSPDAVIRRILGITAPKQPLHDCHCHVPADPYLLSHRCRVSSSETFPCAFRYDRMITGIDRGLVNTQTLIISRFLRCDLQGTDLPRFTQEVRIKTGIRLTAPEYCLSAAPLIFVRILQLPELTAQFYQD